MAKLATLSSSYLDHLVAGGAGSAGGPAVGFLLAVKPRGLGGGLSQGGGSTVGLENNMGHK